MPGNTYGHSEPGGIEMSRLRLYKMRVLKYYVENKALLGTWK